MKAFKNLFLISAVILVSAVFIAARMPQEINAPPVPDATAAKNPGTPTSNSHEKAKKIFEIDCIMCHGANGNGKTPLASDMHKTLPDWTNENSLTGKSDAQLFDIIRKGKDQMPAEVEGRANDEMVWNLIRYIRSMANTQSAAPAN